MNAAEQLQAAAENAARHTVDACYDEGEGLWRLICGCSWEAWDQRSEGDAREEYVEHLRQERVDIDPPLARSVLALLAELVRTREALAAIEPKQQHALSIIERNG